MATNNWNKFLLLMWKNWLLVWRHKIQSIIEILVPALFSVFLLFIRSQLEPTIYTEPTHFKPLPLNTLETLRNEASFNTSTNWQIIYAPKNSILDSLIENVVVKLELEGFIGVENAKDVENGVTNEKFLVGIEFENFNQFTSELPTNLDYILKFPSELRNVGSENWHTDILFSRFQRAGPRNEGSQSGGLPSYYDEGFLAVQNTIADAYLQLKSNGEIFMPDIALQRYPYTKYIDDVFLIALENMVPLIFILSFVYPVINLVKSIAAEKEKQLKEAMKIMGLSNWLHWTGWFFRSMIFMLISITIIVALLKAQISDSPVAVFTYTDWSVLWIFLLFYSIVTTSFCFLFSTFFSRANTAAAVSGVVWVLMYSLYVLLFTNDSDSLSLSDKIALCLVSNTGMSMGVQIILRFEASGEGSQWDNLFDTVTGESDLSVGLVMVMFIVAACLYLILALYIEKVFPGEFGIPEPWYFPFTRHFWCPTPISLVDAAHIIEKNADNFENDPVGRNAGIQIRNLRKVYPNHKVAVEGLDLNMYDDQITVLLGHNGAGKTTIMSMLTGMFPPTSGTAYINNHDIRMDMSRVRDSLGLCPQHNILFDELTVREHIVFYSSLKGLSKAEIEMEVTKYVKLVELEAKINALSSTLSGGMKRKLSICIAFCGGSKVVLCDEPTSGMDPSARRALWELMKSEKKGRTILLSTHFMDEADILGDRIAIMGDGELKCCGSSYFLKKKFGVGYHLICVKKPVCDTQAITNLLKRYIPNIVIEHDIGTELSYQLPDESSNSFKSMFKELENRETELGVESYGVSLTTLEEVFMKVGSDSINIEDKKEFEENEAFSNNDHQSIESKITVTPNNNIVLLTGTALMSNQIQALFKKKYLQTIRNWLSMLLQIVIPIGVIIVTILSGRNSAIFEELPALKITFESYAQSVTVLERNADASSLIQRISQEYENLINQNNEGATLTSITTENMEDFILNMQDSNLAQVNQQYLVGATIVNTESLIAWFNNQPYHTAPLAIGTLHNAIIRAHLGSDHNIQVTNSPLPYTSESRETMLNFGGTAGFQLAINIGFSLSFVAAFYLLIYIREQTTRSKLLQFVSGANVLTYWTTAFIWDFFTIILTFICIIITLAIFQEDGYSSALELSRVFLILIAFGVAILPITYISSKWFSAPAGGFSRMTMVYVFSGMGGFIAVFILSLQVFDLENVANILTYILLIFPHFAVSHGLNNLNTLRSMDEICVSRCDLLPICNEQNMCDLFPSCCENDFISWSNPGVGRHIVYMFLVGVVMFIVLILIEYEIISALIYRFKRSGRKSIVSNDKIDSDVLDEKQSVKRMTIRDIESKNLILKDVSKVYGSFLAVNELSLGVEHSECFGLLGINGAGKTSTFKMLTGDEKISDGEAWIRGISIKSQLNKVHQMIGYCPQFDALIDELTGRETLEMYCLLRGVPKYDIQSMSNELATNFNFLKHIDKKVREYSGGNKRKLSTALALIGNPVIIYLDEPTTGMDPGAKRQLWDMVSKVRQSGKSIVLTSHSMDECEALCTRLAIMVNGEFKCLGSVQHLKNKFSKGYSLIIKMKKSRSIDNYNDDGLNEPISSDQTTTVEVKKYIEYNFNGAILKEEFQDMFTYYIPNTDLKWSEMFGIMEIVKNNYNIEDYSLSQTSLEQVFLAFAKEQKDAKNDKKTK